MKLTSEERTALDELSRPLLADSEVRRMEEFRQHGSVSTLRHVLNVRDVSFWMNRRLKLRADEKDLVTGAVLHDFYLYDWHRKEEARYGLHGFAHPEVACRNARRVFRVSPRAEGVIRSHMWPLTLRAVPRTREAWIVCAADKVCSLWETVFRRGDGGEKGICG